MISQNERQRVQKTTGDLVLEFLQAYQLENESRGKYRCNSPFRPGSDSGAFTLAIDDDGEHGTYFDHVSNESGSLYDLAEKLGIELPKRQRVANSKRAYRNLDDYAAAHGGVSAEVFRGAGWSDVVQYQNRPALAIKTQTGTRWRFIDGKTGKGFPFYKSPPKYRRCWYGLERAIEKAQTAALPLVYCNGEASTVVGQFFDIPAITIAGGGEISKLPTGLFNELAERWTGEIWITLDCDTKGEKSARNLLQMFLGAGFKARALDLGLGHKGDLADFCQLYGENSLQYLRNLTDLKQAAEPEAATEPAPNISHPELGDILIERWQGNVRFFREDWQRYEGGYWRREVRGVGAELWAEMRAHQKQGINATRSTKLSVMDYLTDNLYVPDEVIDAGDDYINLRNGLYNLKTDRLEAHRRDLYLTSQLPFDYDSKAGCPEWILFLSMVLTAPDARIPDDDLIALVQEAIGYSLTTDTSHQSSFWLVGQPASGKSTLLRVLQALLGNAHVSIDLSMLATNQYQLADIPGKRVLTCTESATGSVLADNYYKALVSGEEMAVRQIRHETFRFKPQVKLWWAMNETPRNLDRSGAVERRIYIIPFNNPIPEAEQDIYLLSRLLAELPGIFNWALAGLRRLHKNGRFTQAEQAKDAREQYRKENDTEAAFVEEWCVTGETEQVSGSDLYAAYVKWCGRTGHKAKNMNKVAKDWQRLGFRRTHTMAGTVYEGVGLTIEARKNVEFNSEA